MNLKNNRFYKFLVFTIAILAFLVSLSISSFAEESNLATASSSNVQSHVQNNFVDRPINVPNYASLITKTGSQVAVTSSYIAMLTIYADPTASGTGSSGDGGIFNFGTHAFITVKNISSSNIQVGLLSGIAPGKTVSVGTWGNKTEHKGLWYNLEAKFVAYYGSYSGSVGLQYALDSTKLSSLNNFIVNSDYWGYSTNCSSFACQAWNRVCDSTNQYLSAGSPNTPVNLANSIKTNWPLSYFLNGPVPYDYLVYYANGTGAPKRSSVY